MLNIFIEDPEVLDVKKWKLGLREYRLTILVSCDLRPYLTLPPHILQMTRRLELSYTQYNNPSYLFTDTLMKYIAFNQVDLLDLLDDYPYVLPEKSDYYAGDCKGMHV
jgi:hypothetical protein